jgi:hypothetical protein
VVNVDDKQIRHAGRVRFDMTPQKGLRAACAVHPANEVVGGQREQGQPQLIPKLALIGHAHTVAATALIFGISALGCVG